MRRALAALFAIAAIAGWALWLVAASSLAGLLGCAAVLAAIYNWSRSGEPWKPADDLRRGDGDASRPLPPGPAPPMGVPHFRGDGSDRP